MKKIISFLTLSLFVFAANAQFTKATLQATGLTCAMCSKSVNNALLTVPFVESVRADIKNSAFNIVFKAGAQTDIDALKKAVEDAGFSVGSLKLTGVFEDLKVEKDKHIQIGNAHYHFVDIASQELDGEKTITVVDKDFVTAKQFKKISSSNKMVCVESGKAAACCTKDGVPSNARVYHVTI